MRILVVGTAGFLGSALALRLIMRGDNVVGIDNISNDYDTKLRLKRLNRLGYNFDEASEIPTDKPLQSNLFKNFSYYRTDATKVKSLQKIFDAYKFDKVAFLVNSPETFAEYSSTAYFKNDNAAFLNIIEQCNIKNIRHFVYASCGSVYGKNDIVPTSEFCRTENPVCMLGVSRKTMEMTAVLYSTKYGISTIGLRYFSIYGPYSNPDTAPMKIMHQFTNNEILEIQSPYWDFIYIDDAIMATLLALDKVLIESECANNIPAKIFNVASGKPVFPTEILRTLKNINKNIEYTHKEEQIGNQNFLYADISKIKEELNFNPTTSIEVGFQKFSEWYFSDNNPLK